MSKSRARGGNIGVAAVAASRDYCGLVDRVQRVVRESQLALLER